MYPYVKWDGVHSAMEEKACWRATVQRHSTAFTKQLCAFVLGKT